MSLSEYMSIQLYNSNSQQIHIFSTIQCLYLESFLPSAFVAHNTAQLLLQHYITTVCIQVKSNFSPAVIFLSLAGCKTLFTSNTTIIIVAGLVPCVPVSCLISAFVPLLLQHFITTFFQISRHSLMLPLSFLCNQFSGLHQQFLRACCSHLNLQETALDLH